MPTFAKIAVGVLAAFGALQLAGLLLVVTHGAMAPGSTCTAYPVMDIESPDGAARVTVENRQCGGHELRTDVSVSTEGLAAGSHQTVFSARSSIEHAGSYMPLQLRVTWLDASHLEIRHPRGVKPDTRVNSVGDARITYVETEGAP